MPTSSPCEFCVSLSIHRKQILKKAGRSSGCFAVVALLLSLLASASPVLAQGISLVQTAGTTNDASASSISRSFGSSNLAGDLIVVVVSWGDRPAPAVSATDTLKNLYRVAVSDYNPGNRQGLAILYAYNIHPGANTVSVNLGRSVQYRRIIISEYSGIATTLPLDVTARHQATATTAGNGVTSTAGTTTTSGDLIFGAVMDDSGGFGTITAGTGFTRRAVLNNMDTATEDLVQTTAGPTAATFTFSLADHYLAQMAAFRAANPGTGGSGQFSLACTPTTLASGATSICTIATTQPAPSGGSAFALLSSNTSLTVPASVTVPAGSSSASFSATAGTVTSNKTITVTATSNAYTNKTSSATITVTALPPPISVSVAPPAASVQVAQTAPFTATVQNDAQNRGVTWSLSGAGCSGAACGTLGNVTTSSVAYTAPASVPAPATVSLTATSVTDTSKTRIATITVTALPPPISVSVAPPAASVQVAQTAPFTATVQNDAQNRGVVWNLSGSGCSGAACGLLDNVTSTSVTYTAPASDPGSTVTLTATSLADGTKTSSAEITITGAPPAGAASPTLVQTVSTASTQLNTLSSLKIQLPNATLPGNCLIVAFQTDTTSGLSVAVTDERSDTFTAGPTQGGNQNLRLYYALNISAGSTSVTLTFSGGTPGFVAGVVSEFSHIATSAASDGTCAAGGLGTSIACGAFAPSTSGDLIYQYAVQDSDSIPIKSFTQGASPFALLHADILDSQAAQYQVQASAASINPTITMSPSFHWGTLGIALKSAAAGTLPPPGIRVVHVQHESIPCSFGSPLALQFPTTGNLIVVDYIGSPSRNISSIADGNGNTYASTGAVFNNAGFSGDVQRFHADNATSSTSMTGPNLTEFGACTGGSTAVLYDVTGAATSPYDATAGRQTAIGDEVATASTFAGCTITPTNANELILQSVAVEFNTVKGISPGNFLSAFPSPITNPDLLNQNNGWAVQNSSGTSPIRYVWLQMGTGGVGHFASTCDAFRAP